MMMLTRAWREFCRNDQVLLFVLAVAIGMAAGYGAIGFRMVAAGFQFFLFGNYVDQIVSHVGGLPWWHVLLVPTFGGASCR